MIELGSRQIDSHLDEAKALYRAYGDNSVRVISLAGVHEQNQRINIRRRVVAKELSAILQSPIEDKMIYDLPYPDGGGDGRS